MIRPRTPVPPVVKIFKQNIILTLIKRGFRAKANGQLRLFVSRLASLPGA